MVYAYNELTGEVDEYKVTHTINHVDEDIIHLYIDGELIETTAEHPFYTDDGFWVNAAELQPGEMILSLDGDYGVVESVVVIEDANQPMFNLTVDAVHTFAVGDGDWVVHNSAYNCTVDEALKGFSRNHGHFSSRGQGYSVRREDMRHILKRHHPDFYDPKQARRVNDQFDANLTVDDIMSLLKRTIKESDEPVMMGTTEIYRATIDGIIYEARVVSGNVQTFFPDL